MAVFTPLFEPAPFPKVKPLIFKSDENILAPPIV